MKKIVIMSVSCMVIGFSGDAVAQDMNCTLKQHSNWIDAEGQEYPRDVFMMYDNATDKQECLTKCLAYSDESIEPNVESFAALGFSCFMDGNIIARQDFK